MSSHNRERFRIILETAFGGAGCVGKVEQDQEMNVFPSSDISDQKCCEAF